MKGGHSGTVEMKGFKNCENGRILKNSIIERRILQRGEHCRASHRYSRSTKKGFAGVC